MFCTGAWADAQRRHDTGLEDVDLWVGGLAEVTNLFGGLLGSTFNYVFQNTLENLQDVDRLYYLTRTPGMNLRTQLEGNSFAELIERNTDGTQHAEGRRVRDGRLQVRARNLPARRPAFTPIRRRRSPTTRDDRLRRDALLLRKPDGTIQYRARNSVDPSGINGQSVYNGRDARRPRVRRQRQRHVLGRRAATTSSRATAATTSRSAATATTSSPISTAPTS